MEEALAHVQDALLAVIELYEDLGKPLPPQICHQVKEESITFEYAVALP
jgi:antitoxin HicB